MKKLTFSLIASLVFLINTYGQLNPVNNLAWQHWYTMPNNFFRLTWAPPDSSQDTLVGYNVYRENELFRFQTDNFLNHEEYGIGNVGDTFITYNYLGFWMHVTAVYNNTHTESGYIDSAHCDGVAIGINEPKNISKLIYPNPAKEKVIFLSPDKAQHIEIYNSDGKILQKFKQTGEIDLRTYPKGVLFFRITTEKNIFFEKVIHE